MKFAPFWAALLLSVFLIPASAQVAGQAAGEADDPVVLTVGDEQITKSMFELIVGTLPASQQAQVQTPEARRKLAEQIVELKVMAQEGRRRRLDLDPSVQMQVVLQAERILATRTYEQMVAEPPDEAMLRAYYDEHRDDYEQATGSHILIRFEGSPLPVREGQEDLSEIEALQKISALRDRIEAGETFADIAKAESDDQSSGTNGGDLGVFRRGEMIEEFTDTAFTIPIGEVSDPIKTQYGYHLITIRERGFIPFEDVKDEIAEKLAPQIGREKVDEAKAATNIVFNDEYFGGAPAAADPFAPPTQQ